jgi:hypothetical protein
MSPERTQPSQARSKGLGVLVAIVTAIGWGIACGVLRAPYWPAALGGISLAALAFWLERAVLVSPETAQRKDFRLILVAGYGFFAVVGVGVVSLSALLATWYLPHL